MPISQEAKELCKEVVGNMLNGKSSFCRDKFNPNDPKEVMDFVKNMYLKHSLKKELLEETLGYWIEYNHSFSLPLDKGGRRESNETFTWLDEDNTQMDMLYQ